MWALYMLGGIALNVLNVLLFFLQVAAIYAGLEYWLEWPQWACFILALALVFINPVPLVSGVAGILGAHYAWGWSWWLSILLFVGMSLLAIVLSVLISGTTLAAASVRNWYNERSETIAGTGRKVASTVTVVVVLVVVAVVAKYVGVAWYEGTANISDKFRDKAKVQVPLPEGHPLHAYLQNQMTELGQDERFQEFIRSNPGISPNEVMGDGLSRLTDHQAEQRVVTLQEILKSATDADCAQIVTIQETPTSVQNRALYNALGAASPAVRDAWFKVMREAVIAVVTDVPRNVFDPNEAMQAFEREVSKQPTARLRIMQKGYSKQETVTDADLCAAGKMLLQIAIEASGSDKALLIRALSSQ
ncbi:magnesium transporter [Paenalcaligenes suwonensis]|uniref:magnesium transporter n=1 Tax=Paenalcaligenes suwonensis TaxID=1202713 RepID=UPI00140C8172|nr:magnesium transporter [Paenalcaligenes suwonensis]NHC63199.1 magnesium transporter [Paenalcaligenes suwonensis]